MPARRTPRSAGGGGGGGVSESISQIFLHVDISRPRSGKSQQFLFSCSRTPSGSIRSTSGRRTSSRGRGIWLRRAAESTEGASSSEFLEDGAARWRSPPFEPPIEAIKAEQKAPLILVEHFARTSDETATSSSRDGGSTERGSSDEEVPEAARRGWGRRYTRREMEEATGGLAAVNVIGEGGYGVVSRGVLRNNTAVAIKNLRNNRGQAEKDFRMEVQTIGRVRHKNLFSLLGYCSKGAYRMLVYHYMENSNLDKWLHHDDSEISPLRTWDIRMHILLGTAKGLAYLYEGLEPKIVHRDVKSSNILLD